MVGIKRQSSNFLECIETLVNMAFENDFQTLGDKIILFREKLKIA